jgi:hypothetical protein
MKTSDHPAAIASDVFSSFLCLCRNRAICPLRAEVFKRSPMAPALSNSSLCNLARQGIPLHDQCGAEAPQDELFFVREWRAD